MCSSSSDLAIGPKLWSWSLGKAFTAWAIYFILIIHVMFIPDNLENRDKRKKITKVPMVRDTTVNIFKECFLLNRIGWFYTGCFLLIHTYAYIYVSAFYQNRDLTVILFCSLFFISTIYQEQLSTSINMAKILFSKKSILFDINRIRML